MTDEQAFKVGDHVRPRDGATDLSGAIWPGEVFEVVAVIPPPPAGYTRILVGGPADKTVVRVWQALDGDGFSGTVTMFIADDMEAV